jgi:hypothetical protein
MPLSTHVAKIQATWFGSSLCTSSFTSHPSVSLWVKWAYRTFLTDTLPDAPSSYLASYHWGSPRLALLPHTGLPPVLMSQASQHLPQAIQLAIPLAWMAGLHIQMSGSLISFRSLLKLSLSPGSPPCHSLPPYVAHGFLQSTWQYLTLYMYLFPYLPFLPRSPEYQFQEDRDLTWFFFLLDPSSS